MDYGQFKTTMRDEGIEGFKRFYSFYPGEVVDNQDPETMGRLKIKCVPLYGEDLPDYWAFPSSSVAGAGHGIFWIPEIGDPIYVTCQGGDPRFPYWGYGWWTRGSAPLGANPSTRILQTKAGHRIELNDADSENFINIKHAGGFEMKISQDGIFLGKSGANLGKFLDDLFALFAATTVPTTGGPAPFNNLADYNAMRDTITDFLKTS